MATRVRPAVVAGVRSETGDVATVMVSGFRLRASGLWKRLQAVVETNIYTGRCINSQGSSVRYSFCEGSVSMKVRRQSAILDAVQHQPVRSQEQLRRQLRVAGFDVTQATL